jgi:hypothetical protein
MRFKRPAAIIGLCIVTTVPATGLPIDAGEFLQQSQVRYTTEHGLPEEGIRALQLGPDANVYAQANAGGVYQFENGQWSKTGPLGIDDAFARSEPTLQRKTPSGHSIAIRGTAQKGGEIAYTTEHGLYIGDESDWKLVLPQQGDTRWAPVDVRAVVYDDEGQLWFAAPQGVGYRIRENDWRLFTGADGLPYNDFTCMAAGDSGVWFGTTNGLIQYHNGDFSFRQGGRWLLDNHVNDILVDGHDVWVATDAGISKIVHQPMTLAGKAQFYEAEIEKYHRRTKFGFVNPSTLSTPGDKSTATPRASDNDGFNTGLFLSAMSWAYAATGDEQYRDHAHNSFRALAFLSEVTQGGEHPAPKGFIARNVIPTTEPDPNEIYDLQYDIGRQERDKLWKIIQPRLPIDETGEWYWKCDSSSDELDGHFLGYAVYYDHVCKTEAEKDAVRKVVRRIIDHILKHDYSLVDHDGQPTRWAHFSPDDLNRNEAWVAERGLNSYSILTYLQIAHHILGDKKYRNEYLKLAHDHGYAMNGMTQYKHVEGPNDPGHQPDDNMAFMNYYHLIRYETDPELLNMYHYAIHTHWQYEQYDRNAFTNFIFAACTNGKIRTDHWGTTELSPPMECYEDAVDTLKRYPIDLVEWPMSNAHRTDLRVVATNDDGQPVYGGRNDGYAYPIDERHETYWDWNLWGLTSNADGTTLRPGFHYLVAYYLGRHHGFIAE